MVDTAPWWNNLTRVVSLAVVVTELFIEGYCFVYVDNSAVSGSGRI